MLLREGGDSLGKNVCSGDGAGAQHQFAAQCPAVSGQGLQRFVTQAIGMGERAALEIDRWLRGAAAAEQAPLPAVPFSAINTFYHPGASRVAGGREAAADLEQALAEAARCFSCGECTFCDNCFNYCPDMAVRRVNGGYAIAGDYCKGCGLCVRECPTGSIVMQEELR